jgi:hypothetical protein
LLRSQFRNKGFVAARKVALANSPRRRGFSAERLPAQSAPVEDLTAGAAARDQTALRSTARWSATCPASVAMPIDPPVRIKRDGP